MAAQQPAPAVDPGALAMLALVAAPLVIAAGAEPRAVAQLNAQQELDAIVDACEGAPDPAAITITPVIATADALGQAFATRATPFDILHFTGHGSVSDDGVALALEDAFGAVREMGVEELRAQLWGHPPRVAFLSACHSAALADALLLAGVPHVVAINAADAVLDIAARTFAKRFYATLLAGQSVKAAFRAAIVAVESDDELRALLDPQTLQPVNTREAFKFRLLPEDDAAHARAPFAAAARGALHMLRPRWEQTNLTAVSADPFVGRGRELHELARKLHDSRCVAIHGLGGMGKTALAEAAGRWQHERRRWPGGVYKVELRNVDTSAQARVRIALALGLDPQQTAGSDAALQSALTERRALLILDDLDVLLRADGAGTSALLRALLGTRRLRLLVTARPDLPGAVSHARLHLERLPPDDALVAFRGHHPALAEWGRWQPDDLRALMAFLGGYPFPIRLAATYMQRTGCGLAELLRRLNENPRGTLAYAGDTVDRDSSLAVTLELSYDVLPEAARRMLPLLALFPAGLTRAAARQIFGADSEQVLETLYQHSMAEYQHDEERFVLPEPARRYAEALQPPAALDRYAPAALAFFDRFVSDCNESIANGNYDEGRLLLTLEQPNLRRFLEWGYTHEQGDGLSHSARATASHGNFWTLTGAKQRAETMTSLRGALQAAQRCQDQDGEANVLQAIGDVQQFRKDNDAALTSYQTALTLYRQVGSSLGEANVLQAIGDVQQFRDERDAALTSYQTALTLFRQVGSSLGEANVQKAIGDVQQFRDERDAALTSYQTALTLFRQVGSSLGEANVQKAIGDVQQFRKDNDAALTSYQTALTLFRQVGSSLGEANVQKAIGDVQQFRDERDAALTSYQTALTLFRQVGSSLGEANVQKAIGDVQQFRKDNDAALTSYQTALTLFRQVGSSLGEANVLRAIGDVQQFRDERDAALTSYQTALTLFRQVGDRLGEANVLRAIGDVQQFRKDNDAALTSYQTALTLFRQVGSSLGEANVLAAQGQLLLIENRRTEADAVLEQVIAIYQSIGSHYSIPAQIGNYGWTLRRLGQHEQARPYLLQAAELFAAIGLDDYAERHRRASENEPAPPLADILAHFEPLLQAIAAIARGDDTQRAEVEQALAAGAEQGWQLQAAAHALWGGERDAARLTAGLDASDAALVRRALALAGDDAMTR